MTENQRACLLGMLQAKTWAECCRWNQKLLDLPEGAPCEWRMTPLEGGLVRVTLPEAVLAELESPGRQDRAQRLQGTRSAPTPAPWEAVLASGTESAPAEPVSAPEAVGMTVRPAGWKDGKRVGERFLPPEAHRDY